MLTPPPLPLNYLQIYWGNRAITFELPLKSYDQVINICITINRLTLLCGYIYLCYATKDTFLLVDEYKLFKLLLNYIFLL